MFSHVIDATAVEPSGHLDIMICECECACVFMRDVVKSTMALAHHLNLKERVLGKRKKEGDREIEIDSDRETKRQRGREK